jgi:SAM-dependent methyltransferase
MDEKDQLSMEHVRYEGTPPGSIFGPGEKPMNELLEKRPPHGTWINLGAGDGRYSDKLLASCVEMVAFDIDPRALAKLERDLSPELRHKLIVQQGDLSKPLPFPDHVFDGAFCAATIHIFSEKTVEMIIAEMLRVVRKGGRVLLDFSYDIQRVMNDGTSYLYPGELPYSSLDAKRVIDKSFSGRNVEVQESRIEDDFETDNGVVRYVFTGTVAVIECVT